MKRMLQCISLPLLVTLSVYAQSPTRELGDIEVLSSELTKLLKKDARVEIIAEGFEFTEGPLWVEGENMLLFSDIPANTIYKWTESGGAEVYVKPGGYTREEPRGGFMGPNGLYITENRELWICQHGDRRIARMDAPIGNPQASFVTVADAYDGKGLNSPNDLFMSKSGDLLFTDPAYGFEGGMNDPKKELPFQGVYSMAKSGKIRLLIDSLDSPNGIGIMPDGKTLLVSNTAGKTRGWYAYDFTTDGLVKNGRVFYSPGNVEGMGGCDGFKIDKSGNVFASGPGGIWIFTKKGKLIGKINVKGVTASNCALSPDGKTLYITATQYLLRVKMR